MYCDPLVEHWDVEGLGLRRPNWASFLSRCIPVLCWYITILNELNARGGYTLYTFVNHMRPRVDYKWAIYLNLVIICTLLVDKMAL